MTTPTFFDLPGPRCIYHGMNAREPSLRAIVIDYFCSSGTPFEKAESLAEEYIKNWLNEHKHIDAK